ncbi:unnamed protein product [Prunus armeniaca]
MSKGRKGFVAWKIDLSKACDRLSWDLIEQVLMELKLPTTFIQLVMSCISTLEHQVCVNGELTDPFIPESGIRRGDPLSPYLFVLCIEKLSHMIADSVCKKNWMPVRSSQSGPCVSHLFFADDLILFLEASPKHARIMKSCLDLFCTASGQTLNFSKSVVFCFPNTCKELAKEISTTCGLLLTDNLGKYLGMPILHHPVNKSTYYRIVEKVHNRLATWKSKCLSMAGRITLIQAVTSSIPIYAMQTTKLLKSICDDLDRIHRNFLWGGSSRQSKVHLCQWDLVCRPKHKGGLGLKKTSLLNQAMLGDDLENWDGG